MWIHKGCGGEVKRQIYGCCEVEIDSFGCDDEDGGFYIIDAKEATDQCRKCDEMIECDYEDNEGSCEWVDDDDEPASDEAMKQPVCANGEC